MRGRKVLLDLSKCTDDDVDAIARLEIPSADQCRSDHGARPIVQFICTDRIPDNVRSHLMSCEDLSEVF